jgi:hypothetical protein
MSEPTVFHITHWKAGSQWVHRLLHRLAFHRLILPTQTQAQFFDRPIAAGKIYPTLYVTKEEFDVVAVPTDHRRFLIIRDLRDTLVSLYFSRKVSHVAPEVGQEAFFEERRRLCELPKEDGMLEVFETFPMVAGIQQSWVAAGEPFVRYEDLLNNDLEIFHDVLVRHCELKVSRQELVEAVLDNRFERITGGRRRGQEDLAAHERKGIHGDWKHHFTERITRAFKERYGGALVAAGYERDFAW